MALHLVLTGPPGCGKTTVIMRTLELLGDIRVAGFYTREVRKSGSRTGFDAVGLGSGRTLRLANIRSNSRVRVGRYGVELPEFETLLAEELPRGEVDAELVVIDEIGKMECCSSMVVEMVRGLLDGLTPLLATVAQRGAGFIREVKDRNDIRLLAVSTANRERFPEQIVDRINSRR
jgi:nucleoside-triphosphatase